MNEDIELKQTEPTTHSETPKMWREWIFCENYALTVEELNEFYDYHHESNLLWEDNERWDILQQLYVLYFDQPAKRSGRQWMRLGFQGQYPETDFRGGGVLSLRLILRFVQTNKTLIKKMQNDAGNFFFAITAINLAFFLKKYFHLADNLVIGRDAEEYCSRRALKNFCRVITSERSTLEQMHEIFLKHFYIDIWVPACQNNSQCLLQFNSLFEQLKKKVRDTFQRNTIMDFHEFLNIWGASVSK